MVLEKALEKIDSDNLAVYAVWTPVLQSDQRSSVDKARKLFASDPRVVQYWDGNQSLGKAYGKVVKLPRGRSLAWDIYFVFEAGITWDDTPPGPPAPTDWQHQLGNDERRLDGDKLRESILSIMN